MRGGGSVLLQKCVDEMLICTVTTQRSGSKLFASHFNFGTAIRSYGEVFNPSSHTIGSFYTFAIAHGFQNLVKQSADTILDLYFAELTLAGRLPVHFDIMYNQLELPCLSYNPYEFEFIYGYLRRHKGIVISLERGTRDTFLSRKFLEISGIAHRFKGDASVVYGGPPLTIDANEYRTYKAHTSRMRARLHEAMASYEYFVSINYEDVLNGIPEQVKDLILRNANDHGMAIETQHIQMRENTMQSMGVSYKDVFENFDVIERIDAETESC